MGAEFLEVTAYKVLSDRWSSAGLEVSVQYALCLLTEELLQDVYDSTGFRKAAVLGSCVLKQHIPIPTALKKETAAEQSVVTHFSLTNETLQVVHVLDGLHINMTGTENTNFNMTKTASYCNTQAKQ